MKYVPEKPDAKFLYSAKKYREAENDTLEE
jgi:hypothetical protein